MTAVHVSQMVVLDDDLAGLTAGVAGDALAYEHGVPGGTFSWKADGVVLDRSAVIPTGVKVLELIEVPAEPAPPPAPPLDDDDE